MLGRIAFGRSEIWQGFIYILNLIYRVIYILFQNSFSGVLVQRSESYFNKYIKKDLQTKSGAHKIYTNFFYIGLDLFYMP